MPTAKRYSIQMAILLLSQIGLSISGLAISKPQSQTLASLTCKNWKSYQKSLPPAVAESPAPSSSEATPEGDETSIVKNVEASPEKQPEAFDQLIISKSKRQLIAFSHSKAIKQYSVSIGQNPKGAKTQEGDFKTPEGQYYIQSKNSKSKYYLSLLISYPSDKDLELAEKLQVRPGDSIMLHGFPLDPSERAFANERHTTTQDWTQGCVAVNDDEIAEIYTRVSVQTPILICP